jgi:hypothetical protein
VTLVFKELEKTDHGFRFDIVNIECRNVALALRREKPKKEFKTVPVTVNSMTTHSPKPRQVIGEKFTQSTG